jgi:DNA polymerase II large subunit
MKRVILFAVVGSFCAIALAANPRAFISRGRGSGVVTGQFPDGEGPAQTNAKTKKKKDQQAEAAPTTQAQPATEPAFVTGQTEIQKANAQLVAVTAKLRAKFEETQDYKDAAAEQQTAHTDYNAAQKSVQESLASNPQYAAALEARKQAEDKLAAARSESPETVPQLATEAMKARVAVKDIEKNLGGKDESLVKSKAQMDAADEKVAKLHASFEASMKTDPDYVAAKSALDAARGTKTASAK